MGTVEAAKTEETAETAEGRRDALSITDRRTGKVYEVPIVNGTVRAMDLRQIKTGPDDFGLMSYDPAFLNTASCTSRITLHRRRQGDPPLPRLSDRGPGGEVHVPRGRLPAPLRRAAEPQAVRGVGPRDHVPHHDPREPEEGHGRVQLRRAPDGHADRHRRRHVDLLSRGARRPRPGRADQADPPPDRQDADGRRVRVQALDGDAVHLPVERPRLQRELPDDALQDAGRGLQAEPGRSCARSTCSSSSTPTTSRTAAPTRCGASARPTRTRTRRWPAPRPRSTVRSTEARTRKS